MGMCNSMTFSKETNHESKDSKPTGTEFQSFALAAQLLKNVTELGYTPLLQSSSKEPSYYYSSRRPTKHVVLGEC